jgi:hypothetical protein
MVNSDRARSRGGDPIHGGAIERWCKAGGAIESDAARARPRPLSAPAARYSVRARRRASASAGVRRSSRTRSVRRSRSLTRYRPRERSGSRADRRADRFLNLLRTRGRRLPPRLTRTSTPAEPPIAPGLTRRATWAGAESGALVDVDDRQIMIGPQRVDDHRADEAGTDHEDRHADASVPAHVGRRVQLIVGRTLAVSAVPAGGPTPRWPMRRMTRSPIA